MHHGPWIKPSDLMYLKYVTFLQEILKRNGYLTIAIDWLGRWHKRGFDVYLSPLMWSGGRLRQSFFSLMTRMYSSPLISRTEKLRSLIGFHHYISSLVWQYGKRALTTASDITDLALKILNKTKGRKVFLLLHYWDTHAPYTSPPHHRFSPKKILSPFLSFSRIFGVSRFKIFEMLAEMLVKHYYHALKSIDNELGKLFTFIESAGLLDDSIIILTSDHGESLVEHGIFYSHHGLYDVTVHVPLILVSSALPKGLRLKGIVQHVDIFPTLLSLIGVKPPFCDGKSLLPCIESRGSLKTRDVALMIETSFQYKRALRTERFKYIEAVSPELAICRSCRCVHGGFRELYDLMKDPNETKNIVNENVEVAQEFSALLKYLVNLYLMRRERLKLSHIIKKSSLIKTEMRNSYIL